MSVKRKAQILAQQQAIITRPFFQNDPVSFS
jgi:hypothetical protein